MLRGGQSPKALRSYCKLKEVPFYHISREGQICSRNISAFPRLLWVHICAPCNPMIQSVLLIGTVAKFAKQNGWNGWFTPHTISIDCRKLQKTADADKIKCYAPDCSETRGHRGMSPAKPITRCICLALAVTYEQLWACSMVLLSCFQYWNAMSKYKTHFWLRQEHPDLPMPQCSE